MRKRLWQLHSWLGLIAGLGLVVIGLTGSVLVFRDELEALVNPALVRVEPAGAGRLPLDTLLAEANRQLPGYEITGWLVRDADDARAADVLYVIRHGSNEWLIATLDPYTGRLLASPRADTATLTGWLLELHYAFFSDHAGILVAGLFAAMLCALGVTGLWIYRNFWKTFFTIRWYRSARILFSDLHKFTGITTVAFNLLLGFTGAYWNLTHVLGEWRNGGTPQPKMERRLYADTLSLDALTADAAERLPRFATHFISLPYSPDAGVILWGAVEPRPWWRSAYGSTLAYDAHSGAHTATTDLRAAGAWTQIVDSFRPLHYGSFGGLPVKLLWSLGGLAPGFLAVTGFIVWWRRRHPPLTPAATASGLAASSAARP